MGSEIQEREGEKKRLNPRSMRYEARMTDSLK